MPDGTKVLVVGGTGRYARPVVDALVARGVAVRVLARSGGGPRQGVEGVRGDLARPEQVVAALRDVTHVVVHPPATLRPDAPWVFEREGVAALLDVLPPHVGLLKLSEIDAPSHGPFDDLRLKAESERRVRAWGDGHLILRPTWFMEALVGQLRRGPFVLGTHLDAPIHWLHSHDYAEQVATAIARWPEVRGRTLTLQGPEALSIREAVRVLRKVGGRAWWPVRVPPALLELGGRAHAETRFVAQLMRFHGSRPESFQADEAWSLLGAPRRRVADLARSLRAAALLPSAREGG